MLDLKFWIADVAEVMKIVYEHCEKEMTTKAVIQAKSALSSEAKRTVLSQEMLWILLHCSKHVAWEVVCGHVNKLMKKIQYSGYSKTFRFNVVNSALTAMETIREKE